MISTSRIPFAAVVRAFIWPILAAGVIGWAAQHSTAAPFTLTDGNSVAQWDTSSQANNFNWVVDGTNYLAQEAFWYSTPQYGVDSVHTLAISAQGTSDTNFDGNPDTLFVRYSGGRVSPPAGYAFEIRYSLDGGAPGSGTSDLSEQITIFNAPNYGSLGFQFFEYANFDMSASDSALFTNSNSVDQSGGGTRLTETVVTPVPSHREIAYFPVTLNKLNSHPLTTTLSDTPPIGVVFGPGDVTWAYEWDIVIPPGGTFQISKDKRIGFGRVPEPAAVFLFVLAASVLLARRCDRNVRLEDSLQ